MKTLSEHLAENKIRQTDFAQSIGVTQSYIAKLCSAKPRLTIETALKIEAETQGEVVVEVWPQFRGLANRQYHSPSSATPENVGAK